MGLELEEIIMDVENYFEISILNSEACEADTVGKFVDVVYSRLRKNKNDPCPSQHAFYLIRKELMQIYKISRSKIRSDTNFEEIVPNKQRRKLWANFKKSLFGKNGQAPDLVLPEWLNQIVIFAIPLFVFIYIFLKLNLMMAWIGIFIAFFSAVFMHWLLTPLKTNFSKKCSKVQDLIPFITTTDSKIWTKNEVFKKIKEITAQVTGINPDLITMDSHWINDLGLG